MMAKNSGAMQAEINSITAETGLTFFFDAPPPCASASETPSAVSSLYTLPTELPIMT